MSWSIGTKRGKKREERRNTRRENRKLRKNGPEKQYYGGSQQELDDLRKDARTEVRGSRDRYGSAADRIDAVEDRANNLERDAESDYHRAVGAERGSRLSYKSAIEGVSSAAQDAAATRDAALARNPLTGTAESVLGQRRNFLSSVPSIGQATDAAIAANKANAAQRVAQNVGQTNRAAMGLASGMGESGALAVQQAIAGAGQANLDALLASNQQQAEQEAALRYDAAVKQNAQDLETANLDAEARLGAAEQERAAQLGFADTNASQKYDAANQVAAQTANLRSGDQAILGQVDQRQLNLLGARANAAQTGGALALENKGQELNNQQTINATQLGVDLQAARDRYEAAKNTGVLAFLGKVQNFGKGLKGSMDSADMGPTNKLLGSK